MPEVVYEAPTWNQLYILLLEQAEQICRSDFKPEVIVGVSRGGLIPACVLSDLLENPNIANVKAENYIGIGKTIGKPTLTQGVSLDVSGKRVLVVDEIADSGGSLKLVKEHLTAKGALAVKTATLYYKPQSIFKPDFYEQETTRWIVFPWEIKETVRGICEANKYNEINIKNETVKLASVGVPKQLIARFMKEFNEESC